VEAIAATVEFGAQSATTLPSGVRTTFGVRLVRATSVNSSWRSTRQQMATSPTDRFFNCVHRRPTTSKKLGNFSSTEGIWCPSPQKTGGL